ncbi:MAG: endonuclease [Sutterellaceae bacterium]|nr:endonuclease [Sutterellaceae bacterium]
MSLRLLSIVMAATVCTVAIAGGNTEIVSFNQAKHLLEKKVYKDHRVTFYCQAPFDDKKNINLPAGFTTPKHNKRAHRVEWEHVVPAENFGRAFVEWREGDEKCVDNKGKPFKGRKCAEKANETFRLMQADMYNLYPAIGAVNALRSNYRYSLLPTSPVTFGTCPMKIDGNRVEPPEYTRGVIARTTLYMAEVYPQYRLSSADRKLMEAWNKMYPVDKWECLRAERIEKIQKNENTFVKDACRNAGLSN